MTGAKAKRKEDMVLCREEVRTFVTYRGKAYMRKFDSRRNDHMWLVSGGNNDWNMVENDAHEDELEKAYQSANVFQSPVAG